MKITTNLNQPKQFNVEELLQFIANILNIKDDVKLTVAYNDSLLNRLSGDIQYSALLCNPLPKTYYLHIKTSANLKSVLCHEMIHLQQYERGDLSMNSDYTQITWKGKLYDSKCDYNKRPWEIEAFSKQNELWKLFKNHKKNKNEKSKN